MKCVCTLLFGILISFCDQSLSQAFAPPAQPQKGFLIDSNPQGATVYIESEVIGKTPCQLGFDLSGEYRMWAFKKGYQNWTYTIDFNEKSIKSIYFYLAPKTRSKAFWRSFIVPGWGQHYSDRFMQSKLILVLQLCSLATLGFAEKYYRDQSHAFDSRKAEYELAQKSVVLEPKAWQSLSSAHQSVKDAEQVRLICVGAAVGIYLFNLFDAAAHFPKNFRQIEFMPAVTSAAKVTDMGVRINVNMPLAK